MNVSQESIRLSQSLQLPLLGHQIHSIQIMELGNNKQSESLPVSQQDTTTTTTTTTTVATTRAKTTVHITALDGIVNVNSLFSIAIFIGLSLTVPSAGSAGNQPLCDAGVGIVRRVIVFEVISFGFFLFSSLIAQSLKLIINVASSSDSDNPHKADVDSFCVKYGTFGSAIGSLLGCVFLMLSIVGFVQVKLGVVHCGGESVFAVVTLVVLVGTSLFVYILTAVYASFFM